MSGSGISWAICKSAPRSRQITMPAPHHSVFLQAGCPSCYPTNSVKHWRLNKSFSIQHNLSYWLSVNTETSVNMTSQSGFVFFEQKSKWTLIYNIKQPWLTYANLSFSCNKNKIMQACQQLNWQIINISTKYCITEQNINVIHNINNSHYFSETTVISNFVLKITWVYFLQVKLLSLFFQNKMITAGWQTMVITIRPLQPNSYINN